MGMIAAKCPQCGAEIQLDDSREFGYCSFCGTKVMQEKIVVEHRGSVVIDNKEKLDNIYKLARRARENDDSENAAKYYSMILLENPDDWEADYYASYYEALTMKLIQFEMAVDKIHAAAFRALDFVKNYLSEDDRAKAVADIAGSVLAAYRSLERIAYQHHTSYKNVSDSFQEYNTRAHRVILMMSDIGIRIDQLFYGKNKAEATNACLLLVSCNEMLSDFSSYFYREAAYPERMKETFDRINEKNTAVIQKYDPRYVSPYCTFTGLNKEQKQAQWMEKAAQVQDTGNKFLFWVLVIGIPIAFIILLYVYSHY